MPAITTTIDRGQREGLYELVRNHLGSIEDFWIALERTRDFAKAEQLGLEFAEDFRLLKDIGWDERDARETLDLTMPAHDLMELLRRLQGEAANVLVESGAEGRSNREDAAADGRFQLGYDACQEALAELDSREGEPGRPAHRAGRHRRRRLRFPESNPPGLNHSILTGTLIDDPQLARSPNGEPIILLEVEFPVADPERPQTLWTWASCQIEVPDALAHRRDIRKLERGATLLAAGQLSNRWTIEPGHTGKRDVIVAASIHPGLPPESDESSASHARPQGGA